MRSLPRDFLLLLGKVAPADPLGAGALWAISLTVMSREEFESPPRPPALDDLAATSVGPSVLFTHCGKLLGDLLRLMQGGGRYLRVHIPDDLDGFVGWPRRGVTASEADEILVALETLAATPDLDFYPISAWSIPASIGYGAEEPLDRYRETGSLQPLYDLLDAGLIGARISESACSLSARQSEVATMEPGFVPR
jgi:hypothetical protein